MTEQGYRSNFPCSELCLELGKVISGRSKLLLTCVAAPVVLQVIFALVLPRGYFLTTSSDVIQGLLLGCGVATLAWNARSTRGASRLFWMLLAAGVSLWFAYQIFWIYFEVYLRKDVPDLWWGDSILFLHTVPMMAALAMQPHISRDDRTARLGMLDLSLLLIWWVYLYSFAVMSWQYTMANRSAYARNMSHLYLTENLVFLAGLALLWWRSRNSWRRVYGLLLFGGLLYSLGSYSANWAIEKNIYFSGSLYDVPLVVSIAWLTLAGVYARDHPAHPQPVSLLPSHGVWVARVGMAAIFSLPLFAAWSLEDGSLPPTTRDFRLIVTLCGMIVMGLLIFIKQALLDRELLRLLRTSQESFHDLRRLQSQLVQSEKLASLGQLVGGAAHELNNPLTALLGYSELLDTSPLTPTQRELAAKIGEEVHRTRSLVSNLLGFAKQVPGEKSPLDINGLIQAAVRLSQPQVRASSATVSFHPTPDLPRVLADSNQLLQVCLSILGSGLHRNGAAASCEILISSRWEDALVFLEFLVGHSGASFVPSVAQPASPQPSKPLGVGLAACHAIIREHKGKLSTYNDPGGVTLYRIELPALLSSVPVRSMGNLGLSPSAAR